MSDAEVIAGAGVLAGLGFMVFIIGFIIYAYFAFCMMTIANKVGVENSWFAWIPILNVILLIQIADKPLWWFVLLLIPLLNIIIAVIIWMAIAERRGKPNWLGILMIIPFVNFIIPAYLAFSD